MKHTKILLASALGLGALPLGACAHNYAGEGAIAGAAAGAGVAAVTGGDVVQGAAIGGAAGAVGGALIHKDGKCYRRDRRGREHRVDCD
jgi:hypothetical protein